MSHRIRRGSESRMANEAAAAKAAPAKEAKTTGDPIDPRKSALNWVSKPTSGAEVDEIRSRYDNAEQTGLHFSATPRKRAKTA